MSVSLKRILKSPGHSSSAGSTEPSPKRLRSSSLGSRPTSNAPSTSAIKIYIVQTKLDAQTISDMFSVIENHRSQVKGKGKHRNLSLELCEDVNEAEIIITAIRMKKRLERHIDWETAKQKAIVTPQWLLDSAQQDQPLPCRDYAALQELQRETIENCPSSDFEADTSLSPSSNPSGSKSSPKGHITIQSYAGLNPASRYACARASPLICPNQRLVDQLEIIRRSREVEGEQRNALGYERAIAVIKAYSDVITAQNFHREVTKLPYLGEKMLSKIEEYMTTGQIHESQTISASSRFQCLCTFTTVYGIGPTTARRLHGLGLRTIEDMERYYDFSDDPDDKQSTLPTGMSSTEGPVNLAPEISIKVGLAFRKEFDLKIPAAEVEEMYAAVMNELSHIQKGCSSMIVGGYRRGKVESNDVDIVFTHPGLKSGGEEVKGLLARLVRSLYDKGLVTHIMHLSGFHAHNALRTAQWDSLEKVLTVFILPPDGVHKRVHRRLDLISTAPEAYWTAVVGWTGSKMFERDLRLWAKQEKGLKFDSSGITRRHDLKRFFPRSEKEVFDILGLGWVDPTLRNANA